MSGVDPMEPQQQVQRVEFQIVLSGAQRLRPFLHIVTNSCRLADSLFFEVSAVTGLGIRAVSASKSVHQLAVIPSSSFDSFEVRGGGQEAEYLLSAKSLAVSVLRYNPYLQRITITNSPSGTAGGGNFAPFQDDSVTFHVSSYNGIQRSFIVPMQNGHSAKAHVDPSAFQFEAVADPKVWASVFSCFPPNIHRVLLMPQRGRLTLRGADDSSVLDDSIESSVGCSVSVDAKTFSVFSYPGMQQPADAASRSSIAGGPSRLTLPSAPPVRPTAGPGAGYTALPGKIAEFKAIKIFCILCEHLQLAAKLKSGGVTVPIQWEGVARSVGSAPSRAPNPAAGEVSFVTHLSLIVAAVDSEPPQGAGQAKEQQVATPAPPPQFAAEQLDGYSSMALVGGASSLRGQTTFVDRSVSGYSMVAPSHVSDEDMGHHQPQWAGTTPLPAADSGRKRTRSFDDHGSASMSRAQTHISASTDRNITTTHNDGRHGSCIEIAVGSDPALQQFPLDPDCFFPSPVKFGDNGVGDLFEGEDAFEDLALQQFLGVVAAATPQSSAQAAGMSATRSSANNPFGIVIVGDSQHSS